MVWHYDDDLVNLIPDHSHCLSVEPVFKQKGRNRCTQNLAIAKKDKVGRICYNHKSRLLRALSYMTVLYLTVFLFFFWGGGKLDVCNAQILRLLRIWTTWMLIKDWTCQRAACRGGPGSSSSSRRRRSGLQSAESTPECVIMLIMLIMIIDHDHDYHQKHSRFCDRNGEDDQGDKSQFTDPPQHFNKTLKLHRTI